TAVSVDGMYEPMTTNESSFCGSEPLAGAGATGAAGAACPKLGRGVITPTPSASDALNIRERHEFILGEVRRLQCVGRRGSQRASRALNEHGRTFVGQEK